MSATILSHEPNGDVRCLVHCPHVTKLIPGPWNHAARCADELHFDEERCEAEVEIIVTAGGYRVDASFCPDCGTLWSDTEGDLMLVAAQKAIDAYEPSDADLEADRASCYPTSDERHAAAWRMKG